MTNYNFKVGETYKLRGGGTAEILKVGLDLEYGDSIIGLVGGVKVRSWKASGSYIYESTTSEMDLLPPEPERVSRWINIYRFPLGNSLSYVSREEADKHTDPGRTHVLELIYEGENFDVIKHKVGE
jgi:hypothetical protein